MLKATHLVLLFNAVQNRQGDRQPACSAAAYARHSGQYRCGAVYAHTAPQQREESKLSFYVCLLINVSEYVSKWLQLHSK